LLLIFDLDGTLIDSKKDLAISTNATRTHFDLEPLSEDIISSYVGDGAAMLVRRAMGPDASEARVQEALQFFLKYYRAHALENTQLYPGMRELIDQLVADRHKLAVLTNKPGRISTDIIAALGLGARFMRVCGGDSAAGKKPDPAGIHLLIQESGMRTDETAMIGDSGVDVQTARNAGIHACGVLWGFQPHAFQAFPPDVTIREPDELPGWLRTLEKRQDVS